MFQQSQIETLEEKLSEMDLSRYKNVILRVGGHDVDNKINLDLFKDNYQSLLNSLSDKGCNIYVSGMLPRGGTNTKLYKSVLKDLCPTSKAKFNYNHNSFILASEELPFEYFLAVRVDLKFLETRLLVATSTIAARFCPFPKWSVQQCEWAGRELTGQCIITRSLSLGTC